MTLQSQYECFAEERVDNQSGQICSGVPHEMRRWQLPARLQARQDGGDYEGVGQ